VDIVAPDTPEPLKGWGSPTIFFGGVDIEDGARPAPRVADSTETPRAGSEVSLPEQPSSKP